MNDISELLNQIDRNKKPEDQKNVFDRFLKLDDTEIKDLTTHAKNEEAGIALKYIGFPRLNKFIPDLLELMKDFHWSASWHVAELILENPKPVFDEMVKILHNENDSIWRRNIISMIGRMQKEYQYVYKDELLDLASCLSFNSADALKTLIDNELINKEDLHQLILEKDNILYTCFNLIKQEDEDWINLNYLIESVLEIKEKIGEEKLKQYLKVNVPGMEYQSNLCFVEGKNLISRMFLKLKKEFLNDFIIIDVARVWSYNTTVDLDNHSNQAIELLMSTNLIPKEEIAGIIRDNLAEYNRIKELCDQHINRLKLLGENLKIL